MAQIVERIFHRRSEQPSVPSVLTVEQLNQRYLQGETLHPGQLAKILHVLSRNEADYYRKIISQRQAEFWQKWAPFRESPAGTTDEYGNAIPVFEDVMKVLGGVREQFAKAVSPKEGEFIVDLMGGSAQMAEPIMDAMWERDTLAGYASIDGNEFAVNKAEITLQSLPIPQHIPHYSLLHDLGQGTLPEGLEGLVTKANPTAIRFISSWGISYLDMERLTRLVDSCYALVPDVPAMVDILMLTGGKFDRNVLTRRFLTNIVPKNALAGNFGELGMAMMALPHMRKFGEEIAEVNPIWTPDEIRVELEERGYMTEIVDDNILWGQSTAMRIKEK